MNLVTGVLIRRKRGHTWRHNEEVHMKMESEMGVTESQAKNTKHCRQPPGARRGKERFLARASDGSMAFLIP